MALPGIVIPLYMLDGTRPPLLSGAGLLLEPHIAKAAYAFRNARFNGQHSTRQRDFSSFPPLQACMDIRICADY